MKKLITVFFVLCLTAAILVACARQNDRAENNGIVTDDTSRMTDTTNRSTTDRSTNDMDTTNSNTEKRSRSILDGAGDAVSDVVRGATDAVDDLLGGMRDTGN